LYKKILKCLHHILPHFLKQTKIHLGVYFSNLPRMESKTGNEETEKGFKINKFILC
jgi:hypothetical protein